MRGQLQKPIFLPRRKSAYPLTSAPVHRERGRGNTHLKGYSWKKVIPLFRISALWFFVLDIRVCFSVFTWGIYCLKILGKFS